MNFQYEHSRWTFHPWLDLPKLSLADFPRRCFPFDHDQLSIKVKRYAHWVNEHRLRLCFPTGWQLSNINLGSAVWNNGDFALLVLGWGTIAFFSTAFTGCETISNQKWIYHGREESCDNVFVLYLSDSDLPGASREQEFYPPRSEQWISLAPGSCQCVSLVWPNLEHIWVSSRLCGANGVPLKLYLVQHPPSQVDQLTRSQTCFPSFIICLKYLRNAKIPQICDSHALWMYYSRIYCQLGDEDRRMISGVCLCLRNDSVNAANMPTSYSHRYWWAYCVVSCQVSCKLVFSPLSVLQQGT